MNLIESPDAMQSAALAWRAAGERVVLVPTMGALHAGHASLLKIGRALGSTLVLSIFVNPAQFGPHEDLETYPRTLDADFSIARECGVDAVFTPTAAAIYPENFRTFVDVTELDAVLCGAQRPGHFRGVATVVLKLFNLILPHTAIFGEKDFQQLQIIRRLTHDLALPIEIIGAPIVREPDGLALSSRNRYLSPAERTQAVAISAALAHAKHLVAHGSTAAEKIQHAVVEALHAAGIRVIDYVTIVDPNTLLEISTLTPTARLCIAVHVGSTRLIDNVALV